MPIATHILAATDFSDASLIGLRKAAELAKEAQVPVTIAHVFDPSPLAPIATRGEGIAQLTDQREIEQAIHEELEKLRDEHFTGVDDVRTTLVLGSNAADGLIQSASKNGCDLIVLATTGRTGLAHLLIGSVAEKVTRHAAVSVLVVR
ncbi:MAG TPA: universal stress protein [Polyangiaceae bacterium LLY-WYZ-14_1]|nr:universal stress protein [Polyangiaceae bacterium LLY-WYZ-14_1]